MTSIKCRHCSNVSKTICRINNHILAYKVQQRKLHYTIQCNTPYNTNHFSERPKAEAIAKPVEKNNYKSLHLNNLDRRYLGNNDKNTQMADVKHITPISDLSISKHTTCTQSR